MLLRVQRRNQWDRELNKMRCAASRLAKLQCSLSRVQMDCRRYRLLSWTVVNDAVVLRCGVRTLGAQILDTLPDLVCER